MLLIQIVSNPSLVKESLGSLFVTIEFLAHDGGEFARLLNCRVNML